MNNDVFREKLLNKKFTVEELEELVYGEIDANIEMVVLVKDELQGWNQSGFTIFKFEDIYYRIDWVIGIDDRCCQPYQVEKRIKVIEIPTWEKAE